MTKELHHKVYFNLGKALWDEVGSIRFCAYGLTRNALCHRVCVSERVKDRVCGSAQGSRAEGRGSISRPDHWEVIVAFVTTRANGLILFFFFMDFVVF